ncbi:MAG: glutaredoxin [Spirochaetae bacterium HGW-Spirochaetae-4]|nr:MAG: hypothetical protein A2Y31_07525 [Spirochaetes bacterium GWC2_52_13]PKL21231.1 MAG: glutaredoxin [Spirochaetae bacterium HGW-Spirochaetae-4]HCG63632.1 glutaredoxin [Sphaerochaeta sp.]HCS36569.1 glutaredoxin [Sphaerochaeta sp.]
MWGKKTKQPQGSPLESIPFTTVEGHQATQPLTVFALSTCGFCRRAITFLNDSGVAYRYVYMDKLDKPSQDAVRAYVKQTFHTMLSYPFLCIGEDDYLTGFIRASWEKELGNG